MFTFLSKQRYVSERIPAFLLSNILILKIVQTLVVLGSGLKNRRQYKVLFKLKVNQGHSIFHLWIMDTLPQSPASRDWYLLNCKLYCKTPFA